VFFDGDQYEGGTPAPQLATPSQSGLGTPDPRVIDLDSPCNGSRAALTRARRSLCKSIQAVS
jgi:hypothetical protein